MTQTVAAYTDRSESRAAGQHLGEQIRDGLGGEPPGAVVVFASARFEHDIFLSALRETCRADVLVGSSSAGEFTSKERGTGTACALAIRAPDMLFASSVARDVGRDPAAAARQLVASFRGLARQDYAHRAALVMTDALAGHADDLVEQLTIVTGGRYEFAGGGAGDDARFERTHVFHGGDVYTDAVAALEILSKRPLGVGVGHGWVPASEAHRVTAAEGTRIISLDGLPAIDAFEAHAERTGQRLDRAAPLPFFLHSILGIDTGAGHRLRVPLAVGEDGSVTCASEIPVGARVHIMKTSNQSACDAAASATAAAISALDGARPGAALFFDCVATRLRLGDVFGFELDAVAHKLAGADLVGCNTYGQIARAEGQFSGFHNCTAVVFVLPA